jgi:predicted nucleic acid-binding protein
MVRVFLDTNVLMDWISDERPGNNMAKTIVSAAEDKRLSITVSTQSLIDAAYSFRKSGLSFEKFENYIAYLHKYTRIVGIDEIDLLWAMSHHSGDFEDDMQYASAYNAVCDYFITRDKELIKLNDPYCPMTVITPEDFVGAMMAE